MSLETLYATRFGPVGSWFQLPDGDAIAPARDDGKWRRAFACWQAAD